MRTSKDIALKAGNQIESAYNWQSKIKIFKQCERINPKVTSGMRFLHQRPFKNTNEYMKVTAYNLSYATTVSLSMCTGVQEHEELGKSLLTDICKGPAHSVICLKSYAI